MAKMAGTILGMGIILIMMSVMFGNPGTIAGVIIFWVFYFGCMLIKGDFSGDEIERIPLKKDDVVKKCPICKMTSVFNKDEVKKCKYCFQYLD